MDYIKMTREAYLVNLMKYIGIPYVWGAKVARNGLDCSGLVWSSLLDLDIAPHFALNAQGLMEYYIPRAPAVKERFTDLGDLIFFGDEHHVHHVGMCLNADVMIEAAHGGPDVTSKEIAQKKGAKVEVNSVFRLNDLFCILRPNDLPWFRPPG
jgi:cell wall-associated NlpC family hydrolase